MLASVASFFSKLTWQDWSAVIGAVTGLIGVLAFLDQRRAARGNKALIALAERHVDRSITQEELARLDQQRAAAQEQIARDLPVMARRAVVREQLNSHSRAAAEHYARVLALRTELSEAAAASSLDPVIATAIERELLPSHIEQRERERLRNRVTIFSVGTALAGSLLPNPMSLLAVGAFAVPLVISALKLAILEGALSEGLAWASLLAVAGLASAALLLMAAVMFFLANPTDLGLLLASACLLVGVAIPLASWLLKDKLRARMSALLNQARRLPPVDA